MAIVNLELPFLILVAGAIAALLVGTLGRFLPRLRFLRYRLTLGILTFPLSGLLGFFFTLKCEIGLLGTWLLGRPPALFVGIAYFGYLCFGFLGCWTAVRIGGRLDRNGEIAMLYTLLEKRKPEPPALVQDPPAGERETHDA